MQAEGKLVTHGSIFHRYSKHYVLLAKDHKVVSSDPTQDQLSGVSDFEKVKKFACVSVILSPCAIETIHLTL